MSTVDVSALAAPSTETATAVKTSRTSSSISSAPHVLSPPAPPLLTASVLAPSRLHERCEPVGVFFSKEEKEGFSTQTASFTACPSSPDSVAWRGGGDGYAVADKTSTESQFFTSDAEAARRISTVKRSPDLIKRFPSTEEKHDHLKRTESNGGTETRTRFPRNESTDMVNADLCYEENSTGKRDSKTDQGNRFLDVVTVSGGSVPPSRSLSGQHLFVHCALGKKSDGSPGGEETGNAEGSSTRHRVDGEEGQRREEDPAGDGNVGHRRRSQEQSKTSCRVGPPPNERGVTDGELHRYPQFSGGWKSRKGERQEQARLGGVLEGSQKSRSFPCIDRLYTNTLESLSLQVEPLERQEIRNNWKAGQGDVRRREKKAVRKEGLLSAGCKHGGKQGKTERRRVRTGQSVGEREGRVPVTLVEKSHTEACCLATDLIPTSQGACSSAVNPRASTAEEKKNAVQSWPYTSRRADSRNPSPLEEKKQSRVLLSTSVCFSSCLPSTMLLRQPTQVEQGTRNSCHQGVDNCQSSTETFPAQQQRAAARSAFPSSGACLVGSSPAVCTSKEKRRCDPVFPFGEGEHRQQVAIVEESFMSSCSQFELLAGRALVTGEDREEEKLENSAKSPETEEGEELSSLRLREGAETSEKEDKAPSSKYSEPIVAHVTPNPSGRESREIWKPIVSSVSISRQQTLESHAVLSPGKGRKCPCYFTSSILSTQSEMSAGIGAVEISRSLRRELTCSICLELLQLPVTVDCGHTFCRYCIARSRLTRLVCPLCRQALRPIPSLAINTVLTNLLNLLGLRKHTVSQFYPFNLFGGAIQPLESIRRRRRRVRQRSLSLQNVMTNAMAEDKEREARYIDNDGGYHSAGTLGRDKKEDEEEDHEEPSKLKVLTENWWKEKSLKPYVAMTLALRLFLRELGQESVVFFDDLVGAVVEVFDREKLWSHSKWIFSQQDLETFCHLVQFDSDERASSLGRIRTWVEECVSALPRVGARRYLADPVTGGERQVVLRVLPDKQHKVEGRVFDSVSIQHSLPWDLGRHHQALLHIPHSSVSVAHLQLVRQGTENELSVIDLGSTIGTMLRVCGTYALKSSDVIHFGDHIEVTVEIIPARVVKRLERHRRRQEKKSRKNSVCQRQPPEIPLQFGNYAHTPAALLSSSVMPVRGGQRCEKKMSGRTVFSDPSFKGEETRHHRHDVKSVVSPCSGVDVAEASEGTLGVAKSLSSEGSGQPKVDEDMTGLEKTLPPNPFMGMRWSNSLHSCIMTTRSTSEQKGRERRKRFRLRMTTERRKREVEKGPLRMELCRLSAGSGSDGGGVFCKPVAAFPRPTCAGSFSPLFADSTSARGNLGLIADSNSPSSSSWGVARRGVVEKRPPASSSVLLLENVRPSESSGSFVPVKEGRRKERDPPLDQNRNSGFRRAATHPCDNGTRTPEEHWVGERTPTDSSECQAPHDAALEEEGKKVTCLEGEGEGERGGAEVTVPSFQRCPCSNTPQSSRNTALSPYSRAAFDAVGSECSWVGGARECRRRQPASVQSPPVQHRVGDLVAQPVDNAHEGAAFSGEGEGKSRFDEGLLVPPPFTLPQCTELEPRSSSVASCREVGVPMSLKSCRLEALEGGGQSSARSPGSPWCTPGVGGPISGTACIRAAGVPGFSNLGRIESGKRTEATQPQASHGNPHHDLDTATQRETTCGPSAYRKSMGTSENVAVPLRGGETLSEPGSLAQAVKPGGLESEQEEFSSGDSGISSSYEQDDHTGVDPLYPGDLEGLQSYALLRLRCTGGSGGGGPRACDSGKASVVDSRLAKTADTAAAAVYTPEWENSDKDKRRRGEVIVVGGRRDEEDVSVQGVEEPEIVGPAVEWIPPTGLVLGRGPYNPNPGLRKLAVTMRNGYVSRAHCLIYYDGSRPPDQRWVLRDTSTLGTYIRVKPFIPRSCPLTPTCMLKVGQCKIEISLRDSTASYSSSSSSSSSSAFSAASNASSLPDNRGMPGAGINNNVDLSRLLEEPSFLRDRSTSSFASSTPSFHLSTQRLPSLAESASTVVSQRMNSVAASGRRPPVRAHHQPFSTTLSPFPGVPPIRLRAPPLLQRERTDFAIAEGAMLATTAPETGTCIRSRRSNNFHRNFVQRLDPGDRENGLESELLGLFHGLNQQATGPAVTTGEARTAVSQLRGMPEFPSAEVSEQLDREISRLRQRFVASLGTATTGELEGANQHTPGVDLSTAVSVSRAAAVGNVSREGSHMRDGAGRVRGTEAATQQLLKKDSSYLESVSQAAGSEGIQRQSPGRPQPASTTDCVQSDASACWAERATCGSVTAKQTETASL
ncbi:fha domain-containing protein [Cystoisospora suis]|uniref:E3 ubiquitin-protein ligase CHFR n=1 Tax=Cystoisospora suis TaxID=483139 RepID=A0A2C6LF32_9APIC|nr:fha domain-containing protein [Cystoisospora suis]